MRIKLNDNYILTSDKRNYIVTELKKVATGERKGEIDERTYGYYSSLNDAFIGFVDLTIRTSDSKSWTEVKAILVDIRRIFEEIRKQFLLEEK